MRICILTHTFPRYKDDSTAAFMHTLCFGFYKSGANITVLTPFTQELKTKDYPYPLQAYKYTWPNSLHKLGYSRTLHAGTKLKLETYLLAPFLYVFGSIALFKLIITKKIEIISAHWVLPNGFIAYIVTRFIKIPYVVTLPGSDVFVAKKFRILTFAANLAVHNASMVIADSPQYIREMQRMGAKIKKTEIIPYPVDTETIRPNTHNIQKLRSEIGILKDDLVVLAVGRLVYKKGFEYLIKAFAQVTKRMSNVKLIIVGEGDLRRRWENECKKLSIQEKVFFVGNKDRKQLLQFYNLSDVFVMPSIKDKNGNIDDQPVSLLEAMACGKPVVATNFPGISMIVKDGWNGYLVAEKDIRELYKKIIDLLQSTQKRKLLGKRSRQVVVQKISAQKIVAKYDKIFQEIIYPK